jgi:hypothetical protein
MPPRRAPQVEQIRSQRSELDVVRGALKRLVLEQRELRALVQRQAQGSAGPAPGENGSSGGDRSWLHGPYAAATPRVSVVVTLYNYEHHIREALRSVAISDDTSHEVVVVDDASTDGSLATARTALDELPWLPAKVISRGHNGGLAAARNLGIAASRAPYVFILDADNAVYPHALDRLADTLDADPGAAFAYGIIAQYAPTGPFGLLSWHRWSARRLAHGNFVDAMAMLRRNEVVAAGGFASDPRLHGWEDFALCCEFAERGLRGVLLPEIVARYRVSPHSMISVTNIDTAEAWAALAARYPMTTAALVDEPESSGVSELPALPVSR